MVTHMAAKRHSKNPELMHLLRCLFFIEAEHSFTLSLIHIAGVENDLADDLSRNNLSSFFAKVPVPNTSSSGSGGASLQHERNVDLTQLDEEVHKYCRLWLASTNRVYMTAVRRFSAFCNKYHLPTHFICCYANLS